MDAYLCDDLQRQVLSAIGNGKCNFVFWGFNDNCIRILSELKRLGVLESFTSGIIDSNPEMQGKKVYEYRILSPKQIVDVEMDVLVITEDRKKENILREYASVDSRVPAVIMSGVRHLDFQDPAFDKIVRSCLVKSYATGYPNTLIHIFQSIRYLSESGLHGHVAEFGIFKGGTIVFIAKTLEYFGFRDAEIYGFDIFEGFPTSRTVFDQYANPKCEFHDFESVSEYCERYGIRVIKGDICETHQQLAGVPLMFSFFDTDNYSPTRVSLEMCFEQTIKGGVLAFDHFTTEERFIYTIGERMAAQEVFDDKKVFHLHGTGIFLKL